MNKEDSIIVRDDNTIVLLKNNLFKDSIIVGKIINSFVYNNIIYLDIKVSEDNIIQVLYKDNNLLEIRSNLII